MKDLVKKVGEFHRANLVEENTFFGNISKKDYELRYKLGLEELNEYLNSVEKSDLNGIIDALTDQLYILIGTMRIHGMSDVIEEAFNIVHNSNMSKLDDNGNPLINGVNCEMDPSRPRGKILKSKNFVEPNFKQLL